MKLATIIIGVILLLFAAATFGRSHQIARRNRIIADIYERAAFADYCVKIGIAERKGGCTQLVIAQAHDIYLIDWLNSQHEGREPSYELWVYLHPDRPFTDGLRGVEP